MTDKATPNESSAAQQESVAPQSTDHGEQVATAAPAAGPDTPSPLMSIKPAYNITFHNAEGLIGTLDFNRPEMVFTGNAEESAKIFFDYIAKQFAGRFAELKQWNDKLIAQRAGLQKQVIELEDRLAEAESAKGTMPWVQRLERRAEAAESRAAAMFERTKDKIDEYLNDKWCQFGKDQVWGAAQQAAITECRNGILALTEDGGENKA